MLRETTRALIARARHNSELVGSLWAAIDITKGNPFTGDREGHENGYKKLKKFRVRTTSKNPQFRFFNFAFACVLYNVWRLVDLLVKLAIDGGNAEYTPRVDANQFLTVAKKYYGLDPPD